MTGYYYVENGMLHSRGNELQTSNPAVIIDREVGTLLKVGDADYLGDYYNAFLLRLQTCPDMPRNLVYIAFDRYEGILDMNEICTLINMLNNHLGGEKVRKLLSMNSGTLKSEIKKFADMGF